MSRPMGPKVYLQTWQRHGLATCGLVCLEQEQLQRALGRQLYVCDLPKGRDENSPGTLSFPPSPPPSGGLCFESDSLAAGEPPSRQFPDPLYDRRPYQALQLWGPQLHHLQPWHFSSESCHCSPLLRTCPRSANPCLTHTCLFSGRPFAGEGQGHVAGFLVHLLSCASCPRSLHHVTPVLLHTSSKGTPGFCFWTSAVFALASKLYDLILYFLKDPVE